MVEAKAPPNNEGDVVIELRRPAQSGPKLQGDSIREGIEKLRADLAAGRIALGEEADPAAPRE